MKKTLLLLFGLCSLLAHSQTEGKHEVKANLPFFVAGIPEISYEHILNTNSAFGLSLAIQIDKDIEIPFVLTPYYRMYFGTSTTQASGFFVEADAVLLAESSPTYYYNGNTNNDISTNFGLGAAVGTKFLNKNGYVGEVFAGVNHVFNSVTEYFPRVGINIGKRF